MKTRKLVMKCVVIAFAVVVPISQADDGNWNGNSGNWSDTGIWNGGMVAEGANNTAYFTNNIAEAKVVTNDVFRTIGHITFTDVTTSSHNLTLAAGATLTLDVTSGSPTIDVTQSGRILTMACVIDGNEGLTKTGAGQLTLSGTNTYSGGTVFNGGGLVFTSDASLGVTSGTLTLNTNYTSGATPTLNAARAIVLNNNAIWDQTTTSTLTLNGPVSGTGGFQARKTNAGSTPILLNSTSNTFTGPINTMGGATSVEFKSLVDSSTGNITLSADGSSGYPVYIRYGSGAIADLTLSNRQIVLATGNHYSSIENNSTRAFTIGSNLIDQGTGTKTLQLGGSGSGTNTFSGNITQAGSGSTNSLVKSGNCTWVLSGTNTYSGSTTVNAGKLVLAGSQTLSDTAALTIVAGKKVRLEAGVTEKVGSLVIGGTPKDIGTWGSVDNTKAENTDAVFEGEGLLYVGIDLPPSGTVLIIR